MPLLRFHHLYQTRVWGGRVLADCLDRTLPDDGPIGESWEIVDCPEAQSVDLDFGKTLRELLMADPEGIMGPGYDPEQPFAILVNWLDCSQRLSLQVHRPAAVAKKLGGEPKTECWYIADTPDDAALIVGLRKGVTRPQFERGIETETLEPLLHRFPVQPSQAMLLESGRRHAIDAGNLILEIQQNSDTTYRVYDLGQKARTENRGSFSSNKALNPSTSATSNPTPAAFTEPGELQPNPANQTILNSENVLIPYKTRVTLTAQKATTTLVTENFT